MQIIIPLKMFQLILALVCLGILLKGKDLCAFKDADSLSKSPDQLACHSSLIQKIFKLNTTTTANFKLRACMRINEKDVYESASQLKPLEPLLLPVCVLICELFLLALQLAKVITSHQIQDQVTILLKSLIHAICWFTSALSLYLLRLDWTEKWMTLSSEFLPLYPMEYIWAEGISWCCLLALILEVTLIRNVVYFDLKMEGGRRKKEVIPTHIEVKQNLLDQGEQ